MKLDSLAALRRLVEFYVTAQNEVMPHSAFQGQTPDEVFFGIGDEVTKNLDDARKTAREKRMKENRAVRDAVYALGRRVRGRCYCNGCAPECCETQQGRKFATDLRVGFESHGIAEARSPDIPHR